jgi:hypothetical protein
MQFTVVAYGFDSDDPNSGPFCDSDDHSEDEIDSVLKDERTIEKLIRETIELIKNQNQKLKLSKTSPKAHVLGQLSSLFITEPLNFLPVMTDGPVKYTQRGGESVSKVEDDSEVIVRKFGKFKSFKVPLTWIPESEDDEEEDKENNDVVQVGSKGFEEEGHCGYTVVTQL